MKLESIKRVSGDSVESQYNEYIESRNNTRCLCKEVNEEYLQEIENSLIDTPQSNVIYDQQVTKQKKYKKVPKKKTKS